MYFNRKIAALFFQSPVRMCILLLSALFILLRLAAVSDSLFLNRLALSLIESKAIIVPPTTIDLVPNNTFQTNSKTSRIIGQQAVHSLGPYHAAQLWQVDSWSAAEAEMLTLWAYYQGVLAQSEYNLTKAEAFYHLGLALPVNLATSQTFFALGQIYEEHGNLEVAAKNYKAAAQTANNPIMQSRSRSAAGRMLQESGYLTEAAREFIAAIHASPNRLWYRQRLGNNHCVLGQTHTGLILLWQEWLLNPDVVRHSSC